jgi:arginyl-tRNA synthetase
VYVDAIIERVRQLIGPKEYARVLDVALEQLLGDIRSDLEEFGVVFDQWYSERSLETTGAIDRALGKLPITTTSASAGSRSSSTCWAPGTTATSRA